MKFYFSPLAAIFCISLFFSCSSDLELPPQPKDFVESSSSYSSSSNALQSSSSELVGSSSSVASSSSSGGGYANSSSSSASSSSFASSPGTVLCQLPNGTCKQYAQELCELTGTIVSSCNLTCVMPSPAQVEQSMAMNPPPVVRCNGSAVSSGIVWTPANLTFASVGIQTLSAKVENCNNATVVCGEVDVQVQSKLICTMTAGTTVKVNETIYPTPTVTCNGISVSTVSWEPLSLKPTSAGSVEVFASYNCNTVSKRVSCGIVQVQP